MVLTAGNAARSTFGCGFGIAFRSSSVNTGCAVPEVVVPSGHWMAQEKPRIVNAALAKWMATQLPEAWPVP